jgi:fido (protein-threonine AMPylation protein)/DNA-binding XRE family transcriptional regulator
MEITDKLKLIQRASGLTQEKLAAELEVSFPTLNSWLNGKSIPRKKAAEKIDLLYLRFTGQNVIPDNVLQSKKESIAIEAKKHRHVLSEIMKRNDLYNQLVLSLTYNSNKIEGSTLTEDDTAAILFENRSIPDKTIIEQMEAKNHQAALGVLFDHLLNDGKVDEAFVLRLHAILMNGIQTDAGAYRRHGVRIVGSNVVTANHLKVPALMQELAKEYEKQTDDILELVSRVHSRFEQIHPFSDGNGRVGRLLMNAMLLKNNLPPALIFQEARKFYMLYLNQSQMEADFSRLEDFLCDAVLGAYVLMRAGEEESSGSDVVREPEEVYGKVLRKLARAQKAA